MLPSKAVRHAHQTRSMHHAESVELQHYANDSQFVHGHHIDAKSECGCTNIGSMDDLLHQYEVHERHIDAKQPD